MSRTIRHTALWAGVLGVMLMVALACSGPADLPDTPAPTMPPTTLVVPSDEVDRTPQAWTLFDAREEDSHLTYENEGHTDHEPVDAPQTHLHNTSAEFWWAGTSSPPLSARIYAANTIVRANFVSASNDILRFTVLEYLKGSGTVGSAIDLRGETSGRATTWDSKEAILFLSTAQSEGASGSALTYQFAPAWREDRYDGDLTKGYSIDRRNPVWLPSSGVTGTYIVESMSPAGVSNPTTTLDELRTAIAWQTNSNNVTGYETCVINTIYAEHFHRDTEHTFGPFPPGVLTESTPFTIGAQAENGWVVETFTSLGHSTNLYGNLWLSGDHSRLFRVRIVDADTNPTNGYDEVIEASRPLPAGSYQIQLNDQLAVFRPCNYISPKSKIIWNVNVAETEGVTHDALFDPVTLSSGGMGADGTNGTLAPANVNIGSTRTSLKGLKWESNKVVLTVTRMVSLANHKLDFIGTDGTSVLQVVGPDAVEDSTARTFTWNVTTQPWQANDKLMLRITPYTPPDTPTPEPTPPPPLAVAVVASDLTPALNQAVTFTADISNGPEGKTPSYSWELDFGFWYEADTSATFSYLSEIAETIGVRVTIDYGGGKTATSESVTITWE